MILYSMILFYSVIFISSVSIHNLINLFVCFKKRPRLFFIGDHQSFLVEGEKPKTSDRKNLCGRMFSFWFVWLVYFFKYKKNYHLILSYVSFAHKNSISVNDLAIGIS